MAQGGTNSILTDDEIEAALAEIKALAADGRDSIPSLDDGSGDSPPPSRSVRKPRSVAPSIPDAVPVAVDASRAEAWDSVRDSAPFRKKSLFDRVFGRRRGRRAVAGQAAADATPQDGAAPAPAGPSALRRSCTAAVARFDALLDVVNRPFSEKIRSFLGLLALTTIVVCVLAALLFPMLYPNENALSFLRQRRAELLLSTETPEDAAVPPSDAPADVAEE